MLSVNHRSRLLLIALLVAIASLEACAARGPRNTTRVAALAVGEAALGLDQIERQAYTSGLYGADAVAAKATHDAIGGKVLIVLRAARAFERAAASWPDDGTPAPAAVDAARAGLLAALADVETILPAAAAARDPILRALAAVRAALEVQS